RWHRERHRHPERSEGSPGHEAESMSQHCGSDSAWYVRSFEGRVRGRGVALSVAVDGVRPVRQLRVRRLLRVDGAVEEFLDARSVFRRKNEGKRDEPTLERRHAAENAVSDLF